MDPTNIQGLAYSGYADWPDSYFRILRVVDRKLAKAWLRSVVGALTYGASSRSAAVRAARDAYSRNLAFTAEGLVEFGLPRGSLAAFETPFREGMATQRRSQFLGDLAGSRSDPAAWRWGAPEGEPVHLLQMLYAPRGQADALLAAEIAATHPFLVDVVPPLAVRLTHDGKEHFGFADGLSQPAYDGLQSPAEGGYAARRLASGELLVGRADGLGNITPGPQVDPGLPGAEALVRTDEGLGDFGLDGAYLVCRQMHQDVRGFHGMLDQLAQSEALKVRLPDHTPAQRAAWAGSRLIGRWPSGCPVTASPDRDDPQFAGRNGFMFETTDPAGDLCPFGAHIRRANPRDSLFEPWRETSARKAAASLPDNDRRRLLRRGRAFGPPLEENPDAPRGLMFLALGGSIERQFEFVQHSWALNPNFAGLADEIDPLVGTGPTSLTLPGRPVAQRLDGIAPHAWTEGGGYFFLPSRRALQFLSA